MRGIVKRYGDLLAVDGVDLDVRAGEAHALVGENGAGKSTLVHVLCGLIAQTAGEVRVDGEALRPGDPREALAHGLAVVQQHFALVPTLTVAENVVLGAEPGRGGWLDRGRIRREVEALIARLGVPLRPEDRAGDLPVGQQQAVEILKALYRRVRCLVLDEPTASLSPAEGERLFEVVRRLRAEGVTVLLVTHRLGEVTAHADRATVLRRGRVSGRFEVGRVTGDELARAIVGEGIVSEVRTERRTEAGEALLEAREVSAVDGRGVRVLNGVSFALRRGEVAGVAGVAGNGQAALALALTGRMPVTSGRILFKGEEVAGRTPAEVRRMGVACIPEDRDAEGLIAGFSVVENAVLGDHREARFLRCFSRKKQFTAEVAENAEEKGNGEKTSHRFSGSPVLRFSLSLRALRSRRLNVLQGFRLFDREAMRAHAEALVRRFDVRVQDVDAPAGALSGGNRQKVVVGRELSREPGLIVAEQPTRGLDIRATTFVQGQLIAARDRGAGVLLISQDLEEVLRLSDRVLVLVRGRIVADLPRSEADEERIGKLMTGV